MSRTADGSARDQVDRNAGPDPLAEAKRVARHGVFLVGGWKHVLFAFAWAVVALGLGMCLAHHGEGAFFMFAGAMVLGLYFPLPRKQ